MVIGNLFLFWEVSSDKERIFEKNSLYLLSSTSLQLHQRQQEYLNCLMRFNQMLGTIHWPNLPIGHRLLSHRNLQAFNQIHETYYSIDQVKRGNSFTSRNDQYRARRQYRLTERNKTIKERYFWRPVNIFPRAITIDVAMTKDAESIFYGAVR